MLLNNNLETSRLIIRSWKRTDTDFTLNLWGDLENGGETVIGEVADANLASIALLRKLGFSEDRKSRYKKWGEETDFDAHYYKLIIGG